MTGPDPGLTLALEPPHSAEAGRLLACLTAELAARYNDDGEGAFSPEDVCVPGGAFVLARLHGRAIGCVALRPLAGDVGEVKRMFVEPGLRGRGIARALLREVEARATALGYARVWLETGLYQPEAIRLYERAGYARIERYGAYANNPLSLCFEKRLPG